MQQYIDHTLLKPDATLIQIEQLCQEAIAHHFFSVCINPCFVSFAKNLLKESSVKVCTVVGFPLGAQTTATKKYETEDALKNGADEIDMVISIGLLKAGQDQAVLSEIQSVVQAAQGKTVKVIIETALLTHEEKKRACELSLAAKAHFVKTCTGFSGGGATVEDVQLMKSVVGNQMQIKASGGIKSKEFAQRLLDAGATRLGTSSGVALVQSSEIAGGY